MEKTRPMRRKACDSCHKRKIHCDRAYPNCDWCMHHGVECTFERVSKVTARRILNRMGTTLPTKRVVQAKDVITQARQTLYHVNAASQLSVTDADTTSSGGSLSLKSTHSTGLHGKIYFAGVNLGEINSYSGIPFFSVEGQKWISSRTGQELEGICLSGPPWQSANDADTTFLTAEYPPSGTNFGLPTRDHAEECLSKFAVSKFRLVFPVVDPVLFRHTLDLAYTAHTRPPPMQATSAKTCVLAFLSMIALISKELGISKPLDGHLLAQTAKNLMPQVLYDTSIEGLQTILMLGIQEMFAGRTQVAAIHISLACRIVFMLRAHTYTGPCILSEDELSRLPPEYRTKGHLRNLFWLCYTFDADISLRTGQPPAIDDTYCDLSFPPGYPNDQFWDDDRQAQWKSGACLILPCDLRLTLIKCKTCRRLYSLDATSKSGAQLLRDIRELDDELEQWRLSIPAPFRPSLSVSQDTCLNPLAGLSPEKSMQKSVMHFEYHYLMATIHNSSSRCRAWKADTICEMNGISSSQTLALEASRSTLRYLRVSLHGLVNGVFWMVVFYPISAILTIFCHILMDPLDPQTESDLCLLSSTPELFNCMRTAHLQGSDTTHAQALDEFVAELVKLGTCAMQKAKEESQICGY